MYGSAKCIDGPQVGTWVPFRGIPRYGFCVELDRHIPGGLFRRPREVVDVYKVCHESYDHGQLAFVGTVNVPKRRPW